MFPVWETGKHWGNMRAPWMFLEKCSSFCWRLLKLTGQSSLPGSRVTLLKHSVCNSELSLTLLRTNPPDCKQSFTKLQIPFSVHALTLIKLGEVILQQTGYQKRERLQNTRPTLNGTNFLLLRPRSDQTKFMQLSELNDCYRSAVVDE